MSGADFIPDSQFEPDSQTPSSSQTVAASSGAATPSFIPDNQFQSDEDKYGGVGGQLKAGLEGFARGASLGTSDYAEQKLLGVDPKDILLRKQTNPVTATLSNIGGNVALAGATGGLAAPIEGALGGTIAARALAYGAEGAVLGAGNVISDYTLGDPTLNAQKVVADIGLGALFGAGIGAASKVAGNLIGGRVAKVASEANAAAETSEALAGAESGAEGGASLGSGPSNTKDSTSLIKGMNPQKGNVKDIVEAGQALGAPVTEGMTSTNRWVQQAEDALVNGAPTFSGVRRQKLLSDGYEAVNKKLGSILDTGDEFGGGVMTKADLGTSFQGSLTNKIADESAPINSMYDALKGHFEAIPVEDSDATKLAKEILEMKEVRIDPASPQGALGTRIAKALDNLDNVDDLKYLKTSVSRSVSPTASGAEKHMAGVLSDMLGDLENNSIEAAASSPELPPEMQQVMKGLIEDRKAADAAYRPFKQDLSTLLEQLGKKNIGGAQSAIDHIQNLDPEELANKLFDKKYSKFNGFFQEKFPEEAALMRQYQKQVLRDASSKTGEFSPKVFFNKVNALEPEIQKAIFSPEELKTITHAETWVRALPKNFNPSGTSGMSAFRAFFESPTGAAIANARDFGIEGFLKAAGALPENLRPDPNPFVAGAELADKFNKFSALQTIADQADERIAQGARSIFNKNAAGTAVLTGSAAQGAAKSYDEASKAVKNMADNPTGMLDHMVAHTDGLSSHLPNVTQGIHQTAIAGVQYLKTQLPQSNNTLPFSKAFEPSRSQKDKFMRSYNAVNDPIGVLKDVKKGVLSDEAMHALTAVHPQLLQQMRKEVASGLLTTPAKSMSFATKLSVSKFLGRPLDESMLPKVQAANQMAISQGPTPEQAGGKQKGGSHRKGAMSKLNLSDLKATQTRDSADDTK